MTKQRRARGNAFIAFFYISNDDSVRQISVWKQWFHLIRNVWRTQCPSGRARIRVGTCGAQRRAKEQEKHEAATQSQKQRSDP